MKNFAETHLGFAYEDIGFRALHKTTRDRLVEIGVVNKFEGGRTCFCRESIRKDMDSLGY